MADVQKAREALVAAITLGVARFPNATRVQEYVTTLRPWITDLAIAVHIEACKIRAYGVAYHDGGITARECGEDWLCDIARELEQMGA